MDELIAVVFDDEKAAYEGVHALAEMNAEGSLEVTQVCVTKKDSDGNLSTTAVSDDFPIRTLTGTVLGAVVGVLTGPVGMAAGAAAGAAAGIGAAVGAGTGLIAGMIGDSHSATLDGDFVSDVATALTPGKCAVIAEVQEEWITPLDGRMEALGGMVFRTLKSYLQEDRWKGHIAAAKAQLEQLEIEHAKAQASRKAQLQAQIENLSNRVDAMLARAQARSKQATRKLQALEEKSEKEKGDAKAAAEARIAQLRDGYQSRPPTERSRFDGEGNR